MLTRFPYAVEYLLMALVVFGVVAILGFGDVVPATVGVRTRAAVTSEPHVYRGGHRRGRSHCMVSVNFQLAPGVAPHETLHVAESLCGSIKTGDQLPIRYIRLGRETVWIAAEDDGGYRKVGMLIAAFAMFVAFIVPRRR